MCVFAGTSVQYIVRNMKTNKKCRNQKQIEVKELTTNSCCVGHLYLLQKIAKGSLCMDFPVNLIYLFIFLFQKW